MAVGELVELFLLIYYVKSTTTQVILAVSQSASQPITFFFGGKILLSSAKNWSLPLNIFFVQIALILQFLAQVRNQRYKIDPSQD